MSPLIGRKTEIAVCINNPLDSLKFPQTGQNSSRLLLDIKNQTIQVTATSDGETVGPISISKSNDGSYKGSIELTVGKTWTIIAEALAPSKKAYVRAEQTIEVSSNASPVKLVLEPAPEYPIFFAGADDWPDVIGGLRFFEDISKDNPAIIVFTENINLAGTSIELEEKHLYITSQGPARTLTFNTTTADNHSFNIPTDSSLYLSNIIIQGSDSGAGKRLIYINGGSCTLGRGAVLTGNKNEIDGSILEGGGVYIEGNDSRLTMEEGSKIENCSSRYGGGVCQYGGEFIFKNAIINNCRAVVQSAPLGAGGAVYVSPLISAEYNFTASGGSISGFATNHGGAIYIAFGSSKKTISLSNLTISGTAGDGFGGGIYCMQIPVVAESCDIILTNCSIKESIAKSESTAGWGGGVFMRNVNLELKECTIESCEATQYGGGIYADMGSNIILNNSTISGCSAIGTGTGTGGGIYLDAATIEFECPANYTVFSDNDSYYPAKNLYGYGLGNTSTSYITRINTNSSPGEKTIQDFLIGISNGEVEEETFDDYFAFSSP